MDRLTGTLRFRLASLRTPVVRTAFYLISSEGVSAVLGLAFWTLVARLYADADAGVASILITSATLLATASTLGLNLGLVRFLPERRDRAAAMINSTTTVAAVVAAALAVAFALGSPVWTPVAGFLARDSLAFAIFVVSVVVWSAHLVFDSSFVGLGASRPVLLRAVTYGALKLALPIPLVFVLPGPVGLFAAWGLGLLVSNALAVGLLFPRVIQGFVPRPEVRREAIGPLFRYSVGSHATTLFGILPGLVFPLLVARTLPPENAVYFYVAWSIAGLLSLIPGSIFLSVFAEASRALRELRRHTWDGLVLAFALLAPAVGATVLLSGWILGTVFRASYAAAVPVLNVLAGTTFLITVNVAYGASLRVHNRLRPLFLLHASTSLVTLALGYVLLTVLGLLGAALAFAIVQGAAAVVSVWAMLRDGTLGGTWGR